MLENFRIKTNEVYNFVSYGNVKGKFNIKYDLLPSLLTDKNVCQNYALVEKKSEFYKLIFDFDYKPLIRKSKNNPGNLESFKCYNNNENEITDFVIKYINEVINETFIDPDIRYIYCDKNIGKGVHLYYPFIVVNKIVHSYIMDKLYDKLTINDTYKFNKTVWETIVDGCVSDANSLRLPYTIVTNKNNEQNYYKPNYSKSTYSLAKNISNQIQLFCVNTGCTHTNPKLKIEINYEETVKNINKVKKIIDVVKIDNVQTYFDIDANINLIHELLDILHIDRIANYDKWLKIVYFCRNFGLYDKCIEISKKSKKYNNNALQIINNIFKTEYKGKEIISIGSLIKWCKEDNYLLCANICYKYNIKLKLEIKNSSDFFVDNIKYDITEDSKYINKYNEITQQLLNGVRTITLASPTGSGKTTVIERIITFYLNNCHNGDFNDLNILSVVSRRSMCGTHLNAFKNLELKSYLDDSDFKGKYISSIEHLRDHKRGTIYNILILDEINSLISYLYSNTLEGKRLRCFQNLCYIISHSNLVICADSNITTMVYKFIDEQRMLFGNVYKYKNFNKNKLGVNMDIYKVQNKQYFRNLIEFCKFLENDVKNNKSVLIFSDSKNITIQIKEILKKYNNDENYYKVINKDYGTVDEIVNCNTEFINKCVIASPKILYGVDILIPYDTIYCIYKYTSNPNCINSLEYHQQYSRARNCKNIKILDLSHDITHNYYIPFEKHIEEEDKKFNEMNDYLNLISKAHKIANEICGDFDVNGNIINKKNSFAKIHYYKTWFDKIFNNNKMQLVEILAKEAGYNVSNIKLEIKEIDSNNIETVVEAIDNYNKNIEEIYSNIIDNNILEGYDERLAPNILEQINNRIKSLKIFGVSNVEDLPKQFKELVKDEKKMNTYFNKKYLDMSRDNIKKVILTIANKDLPHIIESNKIIKKIRILESIEDILGITRYDFDKVTTDIETAKVELSKIIANIIILDDDIRSSKIKTERLKMKINKIKTIHELRKFLATCYNTFGYIIDITTHRKMENNIKISTYQFKLI